MVLSSQAKLHAQSLGYQVCSYCRAASTAGHGSTQTQHALYHADLLDEQQAAPTNIAATPQDERVAGELLMLLAVVSVLQLCCMILPTSVSRLCHHILSANDWLLQGRTEEYFYHPHLLHP